MSDSSAGILIVFALVLVPLGSEALERFGEPTMSDCAKACIRTNEDEPTGMMSWRKDPDGTTTCTCQEAAE